MREWTIAWTQRSGGRAARFTDTAWAATAALALDAWSRKGWCNASVDAVWDAGAYRAEPAPAPRPEPPPQDGAQRHPAGKPEGG